MDVDGVVNAVTSHALATGLFESVNGHEPKAPPASGLTCAVWADYLGPAPGASGLEITTALVIMNVRIYTPMMVAAGEAADAIDPAMMRAVDVLVGAYSGDFTLGDRVRNIDLLGANGRPLSAQAGYINQDGKLYRVMTITLPAVINDTWDQTEEGE